MTNDALDLLVAVDVGRAPAVAVGQEPTGRNLGARVRGAQPGGEPAYVIEATCPCGWRGVGRCRRPAESERSRHDGRPLVLEELDEAAQVGAGSDELRAEPTTQGEVRLEGFAESAHRAPRLVGQGMATSRRELKSSLA